MHRRFAKLGLLVGFAAVVHGQPARTGTILGVVTSTIPNAAGDLVPGAVVSSAKVYYRRLPAYVRKARSVQLASGEVQFESSTTTDAGGNYAATGLPPGNYIVCATLTGQPLLDPCQWAASPKVRVEGGVVSRLNIQVRQGVFLNVRLNDPQSLLSASSVAALSAPRLILGVMFGNGAFLPARKVGTDAAGQNYQIAVPTATDLQLWLHSRFVSLTDVQGKSLPVAGAAIPFKAVLSIDQSFTINVAGKLQ
jgi:hypothetical protein